MRSCVYQRNYASLTPSQAATSQSKPHTRKSANRIPVLDWHQAINFNPEESHSETLEYFSSSDTECYALQLKGDSMVSPISHNISFNPGRYIIIDPNKHPEHGNFVITTASTKKDIILRQYIEEGGIVYLKPLNPQYPLIRLEKTTRILGVVITNISYTN